ncbi:MAG TPA: trehalose-phosphatase, partial [Solirubrobacteraceae bacterium]|nr:trehalose-phosphatase [Solirubrobacteraceae bacterium]
HEFGRETDTADVRRTGVRLEDKGAILAFHWRGAADEDAARQAIDSIATRAEGAGFRTHWGRKVLEVRPPVQFDKGVGVTGLLDSRNIGAAMYVGDDVTDLDAFRAIGRLAEQGRIQHAIRVGVQSEDGPPQIVEEADVVVQGTQGVRDLLSALAG